MSELVLRDDSDGLAILTLNRPEKLNALTVGMFRELRRHVQDLKRDESVGCVVLRGAGRCFSAEEAFRVGLAELVVPAEDFDSEVENLARRMLANSSFSHAANKRLLEATDAGRLDAGLQWEVLETEGVGPDMQERISAFTKQRA